MLILLFALPVLAGDPIDTKLEAPAATAVQPASQESSSQRAAPTVELGEPIVLGDSDQQQVKALVTARVADLRGCYEDGLTRNPELSGRILAKLVIEPNGQASRTDVRSATVEDRAVVQCVADVLGTTQFPTSKAPEPAVVSYPIGLTLVAAQP